MIFAGRLSDTAAAVALFVLLLFQDGVVVGAALLFAAFERAPRGWHFGVRATRFWPTARWAALGGGFALAFELAYIALVDVDETNIDKLSPVGGLFVALAVIVVAPVSEELFFRAFFYRALRSRLRVWSASLIDGIVFGVVQCLIYERTGSLFAVIAVHAAFNTFATFSISPPGALIVGLAMIAACVLVPHRLGPAPSPFGRNPRARAQPA